MGKSLRNGGSCFLRKRRTRTLERECCFVNGTLVVSGFAISDSRCRSPDFSRYIDDQVVSLQPSQGRCRRHLDPEGSQSEKSFLVAYD